MKTRKTTRAPKVGSSAIVRPWSPMARLSAFKKACERFAIAPFDIPPNPLALSHDEVDAIVKAHLVHAEECMSNGICAAERASRRGPNDKTLPTEGAAKDS